MEYSEYIKSKLSRYKEYGFEKLADGTELIGRAKFIAPFAYLHSLYAPLAPEQIASVEDILETPLPSALKKFYQNFNGMKLFNTAFSIYGLRTNTSRSIEASHQPFGIISPNVDERIDDARENVLFIGGYSWNGSKLFIDTNSGEVIFCSGESTSTLLIWKSFDEMLQSEIDRLIGHHTAEGKNLPFRPTVPFGGQDVLERLIARAKNSKERPYWYEER
jgi:hypothetical protein